MPISPDFPAILILLAVALGFTIVGMILDRIYKARQTRHAHQWGPWYEIELKLSFSTGMESSYIGQERQCQDQECQFRELST